MRWWIAVSAIAALPIPAWADDGKPAKPRETIHVPYRLTATQHVLVRAKINGKGPFNFILDLSLIHI
jgi:hypothetical protein